MAVKEWITTYTGANPVQDPIPVNQEGVQEDLDDESSPGAGDGDVPRSSQVEAPRNKIDAVARLLGDSANSPSGSICEIIDRDHVNGDARQLRLGKRALDPPAVADKAIIYSKDDGGVVKTYERMSDGTVRKLSATTDIRGDVTTEKRDSSLRTATDTTPVEIVALETDVVCEAGDNIFCILQAQGRGEGVASIVFYYRLDGGAWTKFAKETAGSLYSANMNSVFVLKNMAAGSRKIEIAFSSDSTTDVTVQGADVETAFWTVLFRAAAPAGVYAQSSTPLALTSEDSEKTYTNEGGAEQIVFNLPAAEAGLRFTFIVQDGDGIQVVSASGDTIRIGSSVTPAAGNISSTTIGNTIKIECINETEWIATAREGTWTVST